MKIKRYTAPDMRSALRAVQQEQGPDAVILSSHEVAGGIELVAAVDYDEALIQQAKKPRAESQSYAGEFEARPDAGATSSSAARRPSQAETMRSALQIDSMGPSTSALEQQIEAMREMLESRLDAVTPSYHSRSKGRRSAHALLTSMGLKPAHAARLAEVLDENLTPEAARKAVLALLARDLPLGRQDLLSKGGAIALVGPTGVGKTTTAAKLAARHILKYGPGSVQLVGTDEFRIGAQEQLAAFARILGAPLHRISYAGELEDILQARQPEELIIVDTAGVGGRDLSLHQQFEVLGERARLHRALVLSAATIPADLAMQAKRFAAVRPNCLILTKLDETSQLGQVMNFLIEQRLPLAYTSDGQQVPEDLHLPKAADLIGQVLDARKRQSEGREDLRACA